MAGKNKMIMGGGWTVAGILTEKLGGTVVVGGH
jgi:hypothetical protein